MLWSWSIDTKKSKNDGNNDDFYHKIYQKSAHSSQIGLPLNPYFAKMKRPSPVFFFDKLKSSLEVSIDNIG